MPLLGPAPGEGRQLAADSEPENEGSGFAKLLLLGAIGFGLFKIFAGSSEEELEGT